jgi:hypothetical protein
MRSDDIEEEDVEEEVDTSGWIPRIVYEPWAFSEVFPATFR